MTDRNPKDERLTEISSILNVSINSIKKYDYNKPIDLIYTLMWIEELIPNYYINFSNIPNINELYIVTIKKFYDEWNIMRNKRFKREISYKEYIKRKLNYDLKEVGGFLSKYIINQDIDESISQFSQNAYFRSIKNFIDNSENNSNSIIVNLVSSLKIRKNRNRIRFENGGHYVSDDTMDNVYSKDIFEYTKTGKNFGYLLVDGRTIPVYTIVNDKTLSEIELNKFLEYNVNKVIEYYNDFKEEKHGIKKDSKRYLAKQIK